MAYSLWIVLPWTSKSAYNAQFLGSYSYFHGQYIIWKAASTIFFCLAITAIKNTDRRQWPCNQICSLCNHEQESGMKPSIQTMLIHSAAEAFGTTRKPGRSVAAPSLSSHAANNLDDRIDGLSCIAEWSLSFISFLDVQCINMQLMGSEISWP